MTDIRMRHRRGAAIGLAVASLAVLGGCNADRLEVPNYNSPTPDGAASDPSVALAQASRGILTQARGLSTGPITQFGIYGRETFNYTPQEGRNTSGYLTDPNNPTSFGAGTFGGYFTLRRNTYNFINLVDAATALSPQQKASSNGFAKTMDGWGMLLYIMSRHDYGGPVDISDDATAIAPFVSRDSVYGWIQNRLASGLTDLQAGGTTFPFTLTAGFAGFNTPTTFAQFNRALAARMFAYRGSLATGAARTTFYQQALAALGQSFLNAGGSFDLGVYHTYSTAAGDAVNGINSVQNLDVVAHPSIIPDAETQPGGAKDQRALDKTTTLNPPRNAPAGTGIATNVGWRRYPAQATPVPFIRNEELILLRAEARYFTGDQAGALSDLNLVRTTAGRLAPLTAGDISTEANFITRLLYERRYSLAHEGHRWVDVRRFGRLNTLPLDLPIHVRAIQMVVPQQECDSRNRTGDAALKAPSCP
jgi:hypothetical protein